MCSITSFLRFIGILVTCYGFLFADKAEAQIRRLPRVRINRNAPPTQQRANAMNKFLAIVDELDTLLKNIRNKEDADKAAGAIVDIHNKIIDLNAEVIQIPMNLQEFNSINRAFGRQVETAFQKLERTMGHLKNKKFHDSKALIFALTFGMSHPYYAGKSLDGFPFEHLYYGNLEDKAFVKMMEDIDKYQTERRQVSPTLSAEYMSIFDRDSGRKASEFKYSK